MSTCPRTNFVPHGGRSGLQRRHDTRMDARESYKRCYFIDWPILDAYKGALIPRIDWVVDEQRIDAYTFMSGDALREGLRRMCRSSFRVRPWFAPASGAAPTCATTSGASSPRGTEPWLGRTN